MSKPDADIYEEKMERGERDSVEIEDNRIIIARMLTEWRKRGKIWKGNEA